MYLKTINAGLIMKLLDKLTDNSFAHDKKVTFCNTGVFSTDTGNYLIDAGMFPKTAKQLLNEIKEIKSGNFEGTFTTHYHLDHTGGNQIFSFKPIYAHKLCNANFATYLQEELEKEVINDENRGLMEGFKLTGATNVYETNTFSPPENSDIVCHFTGGHTSGSILVHYKPEDIVFVGDNLFAQTYPWGGDQSADPYKMLAACDKILGLKPHIVIPGHGPIQHNLDDVRYFKNYLTKILELGSQLFKEQQKEEFIFKELMKIPYHHPENEDMKNSSVKHWITVMKSKNQ